jgi:uncharacterized protein YndB with AHSA1/START domain
MIYMKSPLNVEVLINAPLEKVWEFWNKPEHITKWAFAQDDWECPHAENDLKVGGKMLTRMQEKGSDVGFDLVATYTAVEENKLIEYDMEDGRHVKIEFNETPEGTMIVETFDPENENPEEMQKSGWQAILNNFKKYTEAN